MKKAENRLKNGKTHVEQRKNENMSFQQVKLQDCQVNVSEKKPSRQTLTKL